MNTQQILEMLINKLHNHILYLSDFYDLVKEYSSFKFKDVIEREYIDLKIDDTEVTIFFTESKFLDFRLVNKIEIVIKNWSLQRDSYNLTNIKTKQIKKCNNLQETLDFYNRVIEERM